MKNIIGLLLLLLACAYVQADNNTAQTSWSYGAPIYGAMISDSVNLLFVVNELPCDTDGYSNSKIFIGIVGLTYNELILKVRYLDYPESNDTNYVTEAEVRVSCIFPKMPNN